MAVVVHDHGAVFEPVALDSNYVSGGSGSNAVLDDLRVSQARLGECAAGQDGLCCGIIGVHIADSVNGGAAQDDGVPVRIDAQQFRGEAGVLGEELGQAGIADDDVLAANRPQFRVGDEVVGTHAGAVDDGGVWTDLGEGAQPRCSTLAPAPASRRWR